MSPKEPYWAPLERAFRAGIVLIGHIFLSVLFITGIWLLESLIHRLWDQSEPVLFGHVPLKWAIDAADVTVLTVMLYWGALDAHRILKGHSEKQGG